MWANLRGDHMRVGVRVAILFVFIDPFDFD